MSLGNIEIAHPALREDIADLKTRLNRYLAR